MNGTELLREIDRRVEEVDAADLTDEQIERLAETITGEVLD